MFTSLAFASLPTKMSPTCQEKLINDLGEGSLEMTASEIIREVKTEWRKNPASETVYFGYCGNNEFFRITIDKKTCSILEVDGGQSDGDCFED